MPPDRYIDHGSQTDQIEAAGLTSKHTAATALSLTDKYRDNLHLQSLFTPDLPLDVISQVISKCVVEG